MSVLCLYICHYQYFVTPACSEQQAVTVLLGKVRCSRFLSPDNISRTVWRPHHTMTHRSNFNVLMYLQVAQRVFFLHEELTKLPSFPRKALEADFNLYKGGAMGKVSLFFSDLFCEAIFFPEN